MLGGLCLRFLMLSILFCSCWWWIGIDLGVVVGGVVGQAQEVWLVVLLIVLVLLVFSV